MSLQIRSLLLLTGSIILAGCQTYSGSGQTSSSMTCTTVGPCNGNSLGSSSAPAVTTTSTAPSNVQNASNVIGVIQREPIIVNATGYAAVTPSKRFSKSQARLMALRSSTLDAYRNLSERVYGLKIDGSSSLSNMVLQNDELRTYIDAYLVGAKVVSQREHEDGTFETVVEMALQENFRQCVTTPDALGNNPQCQIKPPYKAVNVESTPTTNFYTIE